MNEASNNTLPVPSKKLLSRLPKKTFGIIVIILSTLVTTFFLIQKLLTKPPSPPSWNGPPPLTFESQNAPVLNEWQVKLLPQGRDGKQAQANIFEPSNSQAQLQLFFKVTPDQKEEIKLLSELVFSAEIRAGDCQQLGETKLKLETLKNGGSVSMLTTPFFAFLNQPQLSSIVIFKSLGGSDEIVSCGEIK